MFVLAISHRERLQSLTLNELPKTLDARGAGARHRARRRRRVLIKRSRRVQEKHRTPLLKSTLRGKTEIDIDEGPQMKKHSIHLAKILRPRFEHILVFIRLFGYV